MAFVSKLKQGYVDHLMGYFSELDLSIKERLRYEVDRGFDTRDEMNEVFMEIADDFSVNVGDVWAYYYEGDWRE